MKHLTASVALVVASSMASPALALCNFRSGNQAYWECAEREREMRQIRSEMDELRDQINSIELQKALDEAFYSF